MAKKSRGTRYTEAQKEEILRYVDKVNAERGRGGIVRSSKKFEVSQLSVIRWMRDRCPSPSAEAARLCEIGELERLAKLHQQISSLEVELCHLRTAAQSLQSSL